MAKSKYSKKPLDRRLRNITANSGSFKANIYSFTREGRAVNHGVSIDLNNGVVDCTCEDWQYRGRAKRTACKHIQQLASYLSRNPVKAVNA